MAGSSITGAWCCSIRFAVTTGRGTLRPVVTPDDRQQRLAVARLREARAGAGGDRLVGQRGARCPGAPAVTRTSGYLSKTSRVSVIHLDQAVSRVLLPGA